jgi:hypothetical protein
MSARHHTTGRFAALGRQPRSEHPPVKQFREGRSRIAKKQERMDNATYNATARRASAPAHGATAGQLVGAGVKLN